MIEGPCSHSDASDPPTRGIAGNRVLVACACSLAAAVGLAVAIGLAAWLSSWAAATTWPTDQQGRTELAQRVTELLSQQESLLANQLSSVGVSSARSAGLEELCAAWKESISKERAGRKDLEQSIAGAGHFYNPEGLEGPGLRYASGVSFSPDGNWLVRSTYHSLHLYDLSKPHGPEVATWKPSHSSELIEDAQFFGPESVVALVNGPSRQQARVAIWSVPDHSLMGTFDLPLSPYKLWADPAGAWFITEHSQSGRSAHVFIVWSRRGEVIFRFEDEGSVSAVSPDGRWVAFERASAWIRASSNWDLVRRLGGAGKVAFSEDGNFVAYVRGGRVTVEAVEGSSNPIFASDGSLGDWVEIDKIFVAPGGRFVIVQYDGSRCNVIDLKQNRTVRSWDLPFVRSNTLSALSPRGWQLAFFAGDGGLGRERGWFGVFKLQEPITVWVAEFRQLDALAARITAFGELVKEAGQQPSTAWDSFLSAESAEGDGPLVSLALLNRLRGAVEADTVDEYGKYLRAYPNSIGSALAIQRVHELCFLRAKQAGTVVALDEFVCLFPYAARRAEAEEIACRLELAQIRDSKSSDREAAEVEARALFVQAKKNERAGLVFVANRLYRIILEVYDSTEAAYKVIESEEKKEFDRQLFGYLRRIEGNIQALTDTVKQESEQLRNVMSIQQGRIADAIAEQASAGRENARKLEELGFIGRAQLAKEDRLFREIYDENHDLWGVRERP